MLDCQKTEINKLNQVHTNRITENLVKLYQVLQVLRMCTQLRVKKVQDFQLKNL